MTQETKAKTLTPREAGELLGVSKDKVLDLIHENKLRAIILGPRLFKIMPDEIDRLLKEWQNPNVLNPKFDKKEAT